ncbi:hypothetical protein Tco_0309566 [Tanacetum coccineum]
MSYPRFTKIIIDYFMSKDQSISRRNKMFWHTARDDTMFTSMRCISRHKDTQVYGTILLKELTNQAMLESNANKTYYAFATREKTLKPKYVRKKSDPDTSPKQKPVQATKGTKLKSKAKVTKPDKKKQPAKKTKAKGLVVLSEVALTEAKQLKLATKRSKKDFHISHASGSGDGVDTQSKVPDEQQQMTSDTDEGTGTIPGVPDVPTYESKSKKEPWGNSDEEDDYEDDFDDDSNDNDEKSMDEEEDDEVTKEMYDDVNVNLGNEDTDMTNADQGASEQQNVSQESGFEQVKEDAHVTLTPSSSKSAHAEEPSHTVEDSCMQQDQEFVTGDNDEQPANKEVTKADWFNKPERPLTHDPNYQRRIIAVTRLKIMKMYDYGHLEEIEVCRDDQKLYTFKEGDFKRLCLQDIEDMLLLLVQQKLTNLTIDERYDLNVALRMYTRRTVIQRQVEDLQLGFKSYQKKLNLTMPDTVKSNLRQRTAYTAYSDPKESALNDIAKGIRMEYLPMRKWINLYKKRDRVMVQDIDK